MIAVALVGCAGSPSKGERAGRHLHAVDAYYRHDYQQARDSVREAAEDRKDRDVVLTNLRLGTAALADGDHDEAERALLRAYEYLTSGGVNEKDRTIASELVYEGVRVWKGEPYEQAMGFYYVGVLYMLQGDWENGRAAAANSLFALRDFGTKKDGEHKSMRDLAAEADEKDAGERYFERSYTAVESEFALGYLMAATNYVLMRLPADAAPMFDRVRQMRPELAPLADALQAGDYDTLLIVDGGKGPTKQAVGGDRAEIRFVPDGRQEPVSTLSLTVNGQHRDTPATHPTVDLWRLAQHPKWWSLESMRQARRLIGNALLLGGAGAAVVGAGTDTKEAVYAGAGAAVAGMLLKASSKADDRHLELLPRTVNLVPLRLGPGVHDVGVTLAGGAGGSAAVWHDLQPGRPGNPRVYYLRMHNANGQGMPRWNPEPLYSIEPSMIAPGGYPWIMGGTDLSVPDQQVLEAYHRGGMLKDMRLSDLIAMYEAEGIVFRRGPQGRAGEKIGLDRDFYRHVTNYGKALFTPEPGTHGYENITRTVHGTWRARSPELADIIRRHAPREADAPADGESRPDRRQRRRDRTAAPGAAYEPPDPRSAPSRSTP